MQLIHTISEMQAITHSYAKTTTIGFVPTMGALHAGHLSLVKQSITNCDVTIVSIFVNPAQFGPNEDLDKYPRDLTRDLALLDGFEVDYVFFPTVEMMYPPGFKSYITVESISDFYCGASRPGHFKGVATVVAKLVNIVNPSFMYMGEKDYQQIVVLETMLRELNFTTRIIRCPIIREADGLAMSSRNKYLSETDRNNALCLYHSLLLAQSLYAQGINHTRQIVEQMTELIAAANGRIDYIATVNPDTMIPVSIVDDNTRILIAVYMGKTRLIDNMPVIAYP
jgi:pantoate--beta-alanine ligase